MKSLYTLQHMNAPHTVKPAHSSFDRTGLIISLVIHAVILSLAVHLHPSVPVTAPVFNVSFERNQKTTQIVSPSQAPAILPPLDTKKLSEKNTATRIEQIRRGTGGAPKQGSAHSSMPTSDTRRVKSLAPKKSAKKNDSSKKSTTNQLTVKDLRLDSPTLSAKFSKAGKANPRPTLHSPSLDHSENYKAFARPQGTGATFIGTGGISDHLPNLPDGDITLLNAKANLFASFVRRVAIQVFTELRSKGWDTLRASDIRQVRSFSIIEAVLSPEGTLIKVSLKNSSGSHSFDRVVRDATQQGTTDPNPPEGALAEDGNIHFIFKARSWTQMGANARSGAPTEYRWLLLATGLL